MLKSVPFNGDVVLNQMSPVCGLAGTFVCGRAKTLPDIFVLVTLTQLLFDTFL